MSKQNFTIALLASLAASGCATSGSKETKGPELKAAPYVEGSAKVYRGREGAELAMVALEDGTALVQVSGVVHPLAGKVLPCKVDDSSPRRTGYKTLIDGRGYWVLRAETNRGWSPSYHLTLPGKRGPQELSLVHDEDRSKALDPKEMIERYEEQAADGTLAEIARFKRDKEEREESDSLAGYLQELDQKCGTKVAVYLDWKSIPDAMLMEVGVASRCRAAISALVDVCASPVGRDVVRKTLKRFECSAGPSRALSLEGSVLKWTFAQDTSNNKEFVRSYLEEQAAWGAGEKLAATLWWEQAAVCHDGKRNYVGWHPERDRLKSGGVSDKQVFFGNGKAFTRVARPSRHASSGWFYDPRFFNPKHSPGFRGMDYRYLSRLEMELDKQSCKVTCGTRTIDLKLLDPKKAKQMIAAGKFEQATPRIPHGLARDRKGVYYFVDRQAGDKARDFRLYKGPIGKLKRLKMVNIVSDSQGDVFSTKTGSLRLVLEKHTSFWLRKGRKPSRLINVPIHENLTLIYNELGPYLGAAFRTPCDVL